MTVKKLAALLILAISFNVENSSAEVNDERGRVDYGRAINNRIQRFWMDGSQSVVLLPDSNCALRILQIPGGEIVAVDVLPNCEFNGPGRSIAIEAIRRASPLPYRGFEKSYERVIKVVLRASTAEDRRLSFQNSEVTARVNRDIARSDAQWKAEAGASIKRVIYSKECLGQLGWELYPFEFKYPSTVLVTLKEDGRVLKVNAIGDDVVDGSLIAALKSAQPCGRVPSELLDSSVNIQLGPFTFGNRIN
ncbi:hypothetical protein [Xanthomonas arboricola]|uniref:hypothetical protein n=1 Tax=Xanthomonas arboricola TaxID=56448 RepID=UPI0012904FF6|nr:hypothetical protein [Xanthomonas arboricola]